MQISLCSGAVTLESLGLSSNIKTVDWAPQSDILGHPNVKAFITQGGINSLYEAMHNAVPVGIIPLVTDQPFNQRQVVPHAASFALEDKMLAGLGLAHWTCLHLICNGRRVTGCIELQCSATPRPWACTWLAGNGGMHASASFLESCIDKNFTSG